MRKWMACNSVSLLMCLHQSLLDAIDELQDLALVRQNLDTEALSMHRLLQSGYRSWTSDKHHPQIEFEAAARLMFEKFPKQYKGIPFDREMPIARYWSQHAFYLRDAYRSTYKTKEPLKLSEDFVSLMCNVAWYCVENRDSPDLEQTISVMLPAISMENYQVEHPLVYAHLCNSAARMSAFQGDFETSLVRLEEVLKIRQVELPENDAETGGTHNNIGNTHFSLRNYDAALKAHLDAGTLWRKSPDFVYSGSGYEWMHNINLCRMHTARGEFEKAKNALVKIGFEENNYDSPITERLVD